MINVHDIFVCKPGCASKLAKMLKEAREGDKELVHIMTDMTGQYNRVIMVSQFKDLADYAQHLENYMQGSEDLKKMLEKMQGYQDLFLTGSREIYKVW